MDEFGVLVESIGFRAHGKSAPMANLKNKTNHGNGFPRDIGIELGFNTKLSPINRPKSPYDSSPINGSFVDDLDGIFRSHNNKKTQNYGDFDGTDDLFGGPVSNSKPSGGDSAFDLDSVFKSLNNSTSKSSVSVLYDDADDIFGGMPGLKSSGSRNHDDVFGSMVSPSKQSDSVDDLIGIFDGMGLKSNGSRRNPGNSPEVDDLIPGFGGSSPSTNGAKVGTIHSQHSGDYSSESTSTLVEDPFAVFESSPSSIDELEDVAMGSARNNANQQFDTAMHDAHKREHKAKQDVLHHKQKGEENKGIQREIREKGTSEMFFGVGAQPTSVPKPRSTAEDPAFDILFHMKGGSEVERNSSGTASSRKKAAPVTDFVDNFYSLFGEAAPSEQFRETEGESEDRRRARLNHHMRTQERMAKALAEKNQRDFQNQREQDERHRLAETLDDDIKRWAAGKEGNLRALLSSLQYVLWPECGWQPVALTDLITSTSVKKVYYKATLCVHPDKVQQKGANIEQKYIAEKAFDRLKEAWNKFNAEELR